MSKSVSPRSVCPPGHKHAGSSTCYKIHRCGCADCRNANTARVRGVKREQLYGRWVEPFVPAEPVREHIEHLQAFGIGYKRIADLADVGHTTISTLLYGRKGDANDPRKGEILQRVSRVTAEKVLAVQPRLENMRRGALIPARGLHRRLHALMSRGWSASKLCAELGLERGNFNAMMARESCTVRRHLEVAAMYERLWNQEPAHETWHERSAYTRTLNYAKRRRFLPPLAWDDIDNDPEPPVSGEAEAAAIDEVAVDLACAGDAVRLTKVEREAAVTRLHAQRFSDAVIGARLRCSDRTVLRIREELGLEAFAQQELQTARAAS